jgi:hypothetical protein
MPPPVLNHDKRGVYRQQPAPEEQRPFLAAPDGTDLVIDGQVAVGMSGDIADGEIVGDEKIIRRRIPIREAAIA